MWNNEIFFLQFVLETQSILTVVHLVNIFIAFRTAVTLFPYFCSI